MDKKKGAILCNTAIVIFSIVGLYLSTSKDIPLFPYYTQNSNLLAGIASVLLIIFLLTKKDMSEVPGWVLILKFTSVLMLSVTFLVVAFLLVPQSVLSGGSWPWWYFFIGDSMLFTHTLNPIVAVISFIFFENDRRYNKKKTIWYPLAVTLIYGVVMLVINYLNIFKGPYFFFMVHDVKWYTVVLCFIGILAGSYLVARFLLIENQKRLRRRKRYQS